jgi:hypothetical protein
MGFAYSDSPGGRRLLRGALRTVALNAEVMQRRMSQPLTVGPRLACLKGHGLHGTI